MIIQFEGRVNMNIDYFIEMRKTKGFSQSDLAAGICTQATLSRFENNGQIPSIKILLQLCRKIGISMAELFPKMGIPKDDSVEKMDQAEFYLITSEYEKANALLQQMPVDMLEDASWAMRYYYIKGFIMIFQNEAITDILFNFDQILLENAPQDELFRLLAYTGTGMVFAREGQLAKAEVYFSKVLAKIYQFPTQEMVDTWRVLNILFQCGVFYAEIGEIESSDTLLTYAITICSDNHVTYYLARAAIQLAKNAITKKDEPQKILELIYDARAYAKINQNQVGLALLAEMQQQVLATMA